MTVTVPEKPELTFEAEDAAGFRAMLGRILASTPLSCGQIAVKTGMPRSTAYSLPDVKRPGLPSNPDQIRDFVRACGLTPTQIDLVMDRWTALQRDIENARAGDDKPSLPAAAPTGSWARATPIPAGTGGLRVDVVELVAAALAQSTAPLSGDCAATTRTAVFRRRQSKTTVPPRRTSWIDLIHYVLGDEDRTRRAARLLIPVTVLMLALMATLVYLSVQMPTVTPFVVAGLLGPFALLARRSFRKTKAKPAE